jgi:hypothetical protein
MHPKRGVLTWQQDWSPNGRWIAYQREGGPRLYDDIFKIRANGKDRTPSAHHTLETRRRGAGLVARRPLDRVPHS